MKHINQTDIISLNKDYHSINSSIHFIYGASASGKTTLMREFTIKKNFLYFSCTNMSSNLIFSLFTQIINKKFKLKNSPTLYNTFEHILNLISEQIIDEKLIIIFDDFSQLLKIDKNALTTLLKVWKKHLKSKHIQLIVLSSLIPDEKTNLSIQKITKKYIYLEEFSFENILNKPSITALDKLYIYSILGCSQTLLNIYNPKVDFIKNIYNIAMSPNSIFINYGFDYLKKDLSEIGTYSSILHAISKGNNKLGDIAEFLNMKSTYLTRYMQKLQDLMIVSKKLPLTQKQTFSKYGRYYINNTFLKFWFCYIFPNLSTLQMKKHQPVLKELNDNIIDNILTPTYKKYIKNIIQEDPLKYLGYEPLNIGSWWDNNGNYIDIVAFDNIQITFIKVLWKNPDVAKIHYGIFKQMTDTFKTTLKRNYIIISKNTYLNNTIK
jgi:AAA+ ATPase superfamily predicted ATPase